jgi:hypothetical protein
MTAAAEETVRYFAEAVTRGDPAAAITECDIERLSNLTPAAGERHREAQMPAIDR